MGELIELPPPPAAHIWTWVEPYEFQQLERLAADKEKQVSEYVRDLIRRRLETK